MLDVATGRFTVGVFQDVAWAQKGIDALKKAALPPEALSVMAKESPEVARLIEQSLGAAGERSKQPPPARCSLADRSSPRCRVRQATSRGSESPAPCAASAFRRTTDGSSRS